MANSVAQLQKEILALTGVDIMDGKNAFKSTYEILDEISKVWGSLTDVSKANVLNLLGGKRNANVLSSLISNFKDAREAMETAANSSGSAWAENEKYLNSIEGKTKQLQASFEAMANEIINSDLVKAFVDIGKAIADAVTWLQKMGLLLPTIVGLVTTIKTLSSVTTATNTANSVLAIIGGDGDTDSKISRITAAISQLGTIAKQLAGTKILGGLADQKIDDDLASKVGDIAREMQNASMKTLTFDGVLTAVKARLSGLGQGLKTFVRSSLGKWTLGITGAIALYSVAKNAYDKYINSLIEGAEKTWSEHQNIEKTARENKEALDSLSDEFKTLREGVDRYGNNVSLTDDQYDRYLSLCKEIISITPSLKDSFNEKGSSLKTGYITILDEAIQKQQEFLDNDTKTTVGGAPGVLAGWSAEINKSAKDITNSMGKIVLDVLKLHTEGAQSAGEVWRDALSEIGAENLFENFEGGAEKANLDAVYKLRANWEKVEQSFRDAGFAPEEISKLQTMIGPLDDFFKIYQEKLKGTVQLFQLSASYLDQTKSLWDVIAKEGQDDVFQSGLFSVLSPTASYEENLAATTDYLNQMVFAIYDINDLQEQLANGDNIDIETAWDNLYEKFGQYPAIIGMIRDALFGVTEESKQNADAVDDQTKSYSDLAKEMDNISKASSFLSSLRSDNKDTFSLLKSAQDFVDMYNGLFPGEDEQIDLGNIFRVTEDNLPDWDTAAVEVYTEAIIRAAFQNTKFAKEHPEVVDALVKEATAFENAKNEAQSFSDALSGINNASNISKAIADFDGTDAAAMKIIEDLQGIVDAWNKIRGDGDKVELGSFFKFGPDGFDFSNAINMLAQFREELLSNSTAISELENQYPGFTAWLVAVDPAAESAEKSLTSLTDAMGSMSDVMNIITSGFGDDDPISKIQKATKMLEMWKGFLPEINKGWYKPNLSKLLIFDESGIRENTEGFKALWNDLITYVTSSTELGLSAKQRESLKTLLPEWLENTQAAEEAAANAKKIADAMSGIGNAATYLNEHIQGEAVGGGFYDALESFYDLREKLGKEAEWSFGDFFHWDKDLGDYTYKTELLSNEIDNLAKTIATDLVDSEIKGGAAIEDRTAAIEERAKRISESLIGVSDSWQKLTSTVSSVKSLQGLKEDYQSYQSGDMSLLDMLSSAASLAEELGLEIDEAFTIGADGKMVLNIENMNNALIGVIDKLESSGACSATLAAQLREAARAEAAVASNAERLQKASEKVRDAQAFGSGRSRGQQLTYDDYKAMIERDSRYAATVEYVNGVMSVNRDMYNEVTAAIANETAEMALLEAAQRKLKIDEYQKELATNTKLTDAERASITKEIEKLKLEAKGYTILANEISNATNQFERFRNAAGDADDETYMDAQSALKMIDDVLNNVESEIYGQIGNEKYKEAVRLLIDPDIDFSDPTAVEQKIRGMWSKLQEWFGAGSEENPQTRKTNMGNFYNDLVEKGFAHDEVDKAGKQWGVLHGTVEDIANAFGMTKDAVRAALLELEHFSAKNFDWEHIDPEYYDEVIAKAKTLEEQAAEAQREVERTQAEAAEAEKRADEAAKALAEAKQSGDDAAVAEAQSAADKANQEAEAAQKAADEAKDIAAKATEAVTNGTETGTEQLRQSLEEIVAQINEIQSNPIDLNMLTAIESSQAVIDNMTRMVELIAEMNAINASISGVNDVLVVTQAEVDTLGESVVDIDTSPAVASLKKIINEIANTKDWINSLNNSQIYLDPVPAIDSIVSIINYLNDLISKINEVNSLSVNLNDDSGGGGGGGSASGASGAAGIASSRGGRTLVGELGREVVVDVDSGRWYTVGNNGPEMVSLPKRAIVYNHEKTEELLGTMPMKLRGFSMASGSKGAGTNGNSGVSGGLINLSALETSAQKETQKTVSKISKDVKEAVDVLEGIAEAYKTANEVLEHLIAHEEFNYFKAERAADYDRMHTTLSNEVEIYKSIMENSQKGIAELVAKGADDGNEHLQELEEAYWDAYRSMYETLDNIGTLYTEALGDQVDKIQSAYKNLSDAVKEYNDDGTISIDTFQSILDNGVEYLNLLRNQNGEFEVSEESVKNLLKYRKDQLAIETAMSYVNRLNEALRNRETQKAAELVSATGQIGRDTWDIVYAQLEVAKASGLTSEQYEKALENINNLRKIADVTMDDFGATDRIKEAKDAFEAYRSEIEHYIKHQEFAFDAGDKAFNFKAMNEALENEVAYYKQIMAEAQQSIADMASHGADDTNESLQAVEEAYWSAWRSMYDVLDKIRSLRVDALKDRLDGLTGSLSTLKTAADEYNKAEGISLDTFQSLLDDGFQYMSLLDEQNGKYVIAKDRINQYIQSRKNQIAIESALSYIGQVREALLDKEDDRLTHLLTTMDDVSNSTWNYVYAQAALLKTQGLTGAQYDSLIGNLNKMKALADSVVYDYVEGEGDITEEFDKQKDALDSILEYVEDLIRAEVNDRMDAIRDQIDAYKEIIDMKKKSLDETKNENEYQEEVAERVKAIAELQARADLLSLDTSRTAAAERQKLLQEIADKQKDLTDYQNDYSIDAQKEALDKDYEDYEASRQAEIEELEKSISSEEKVYQLAIARIRDQWSTLYQDLIAWNTEEGSVINQEITDAWNNATKAVERYGSAVNAIAAMSGSADNYIVADVPKYHGGGIVGNAGSINDDEVLAVLKKGELVATEPMKKAMFAAVNFVKELSDRIGTKVESIKNFAMTGISGGFTPAFAMPAASAPVTQNNSISFSPNISVAFNGVDMGGRDAESFGRDVANSVADNLFDKFSSRGINILHRLRQ